MVILTVMNLSYDVIPTTKNNKTIEDIKVLNPITNRIFSTGGFKQLV